MATSRTRSHWEWGLRSRLTFALVLCLALVATPVAAGAKVFLSRKEAVATAFPGAERVEEKTWVLDDAQVSAIQSLARERLDSKLVTVYTGVRDGRIVGHALIDIHTVRTQPEAFLVVVDPEGVVRDVRMVAFYEPQEYLPSDRWLEQFRDEKLSQELHLQRKIHVIAGSTLSSRAVTGGVRRALALFEVLMQQSGAQAAPDQGGRDAGALGR
jgi:hypothetical protein